MEKKPFDVLKVDDINSVLGGVIKNLGLERRIKENTILELWPQIVGPKFSSRSRAVSIKRARHGQTVIVAVESSPFMQEMFLYKKEILKKIETCTKSLGFNIIDIIFDVKIWNNSDYKPTEIVEEKQYKLDLKQFTEEDITKIELPQSIVEPVKAAIDGLSFANDEMKKKMLKTELRNLKIQVWRKENGYPCCESCGIPVRYVEENMPNLCQSCKYLRAND